jgi:glucose-1-phosphatase
MTRLFVFDIGKVILPFEHHQIAGKLARKSRDGARAVPDAVFSVIFARFEGLINDYEKGFMSSHEFFCTLKDRFGLELDFEEFSEIWNDIFWEDPAVNAVIHYLKERGYPLFLLSNTCELHFSHIISRYPIVHDFDEWILSFEVGAKKPERRIFEAIFERTDVAPSEVFYIDDIPDFVEAARSIGIDGMVFAGAEGLWQALRERGI